MHDYVVDSQRFSWDHASRDVVGCGQQLDFILQQHQYTLYRRYLVLLQNQVLQEKPLSSRDDDCGQVWNIVSVKHIETTGMFVIADDY